MEDKKDFSKVADAIDAFMKQHPNSQNLVLNISENHGDDENAQQKMLTDPKINSVLQSHGIGTMALESPAVFQEHANKVMWGDMDPKTFANIVVQEYVVAVGEPEENLQSVRDSYESQGSLIQAQTKFGNNVVFFDNPDMTLKSRDDLVMAANQHEDNAMEIADQRMAEHLESTVKSMKDSGMDTDRQNLIRAAAMLKGRALVEDPTAKAEFDAFRDLRTNDKDEQLRADHIKEQAIGGAVVLAGGLHGGFENDLDEKLGAARLVIVQDREGFNASSQMDYSMGSESPDGYLIVDEGIIVSGDDAYKAAQKFDNDVTRAMNGTYDQDKAPVQQQLNNAAPGL